MRLRTIGLGLLLTLTLGSAGCCWCRPWGHCGHRCCSPPPASAGGPVLTADNVVGSDSQATLSPTKL
jgi:hypothetical protein